MCYEIMFAKPSGSSDFIENTYHQERILSCYHLIMIMIFYEAQPPSCNCSQLWKQNILYVSKNLVKNACALYVTGVHKLDVDLFFLFQFPRKPGPLLARGI